MAIRILASIFLLLSVLFMPWWTSAILALVFIIYFKYFIEALVLALLSDLLYGVPEVKFYNIVVISFMVAVVALVFVESIKKKLR